MVDRDSGGEQQIQSERDALAKGMSDAALWLKKVAAQRNDRKHRSWLEDCKGAISLFEEGEEQTIGLSVQPDGGYLQSQANLWHANIEVLCPALYNSTPIPDIRPRGNRQDRVARLASDAAEQTLVYQLDRHQFDHTMGGVVLAAGLTGRGLARVRYEPALDGDELSEQTVQSELVPHDQYVLGPARQWPPPWIAFKHHLTEDDVRSDPSLDLQGKIEDLPWSTGFDEDKSGASEDDRTYRGIEKTIPVWEIWDRTAREVLWVVEHAEKRSVLKRIPDPNLFPEFYPVPRPLDMIRRYSDMTPVCPFKIYRPLFLAWSDLNARIAENTRMVKVTGMIDPTIAVEVDELRAARSGTYVPVQSQKLEEFVGNSRALRDRLWEWPIEPVAAALQQLYAARDQLKQLIYEVTGISDIMRGQAPAASQTATATDQQTQFGTLRLQDTQNEVSRFARDLIRMKTHIIARRFEWDVIKAQANIDYLKDLGSDLDSFDQEEEEQKAIEQQTPDEQAPDGEMMLPDEMQESPPDPAAERTARLEQRAARAAALEEEVAELLSSQLLTYKIDIETDSTVRRDFSRTSASMNQFMQYTAQFFGTVTQIAPVVPKIVPQLVRVYTQFARLFRLGRGADQALDLLIELAQDQVDEGIPGQNDEAAQAAAQQQMQMQQEQVAAQQQMQQEQQGHEMQMAQQQRDQEQWIAQATFTHEQAMRQFEQAAATTKLEHAQWMASSAAQKSQRDAARDDAAMQRDMEKATQAFDIQSALAELKAAGEQMRQRNDAARAEQTMRVDQQKAFLAMQAQAQRANAPVAKRRQSKRKLAAR